MGFACVVVGIIINNLLTMTKEEAKKWSELFAAVADGKTVQYRRNYLDADIDVWADVNLSELRSLSSDILNRHRIKPEPKYVPFTQDDWKEFMMKKVVNIKSGNTFDVIGTMDDSVGFDNNNVGGWTWPEYEDAFKQYTFSDGTPFGKLVEE